MQSGTPVAKPTSPPYPLTITPPWRRLFYYLSPVADALVSLGVVISGAMMMQTGWSYHYPC
jgi:hypothetical protein